MDQLLDPPVYFTLQGYSIAYKAMDDAVTYFMATGGPALARHHIEQLNESLKCYDDHELAYKAAMARILREEKEEQEKAEQKRMETIMLGIMEALNPKQKKHETAPVKLPPELSTEKAMKVWKVLQDAGFIDQNYQPTVSRTDAAVIAGWIGTQLNKKIPWAVFEIIWDRKAMRSDHSKGMGKKGEENAPNIIDKLQDLLNNHPEIKANMHPGAHPLHD